jgi:hypothetical protein
MAILPRNGFNTPRNAVKTVAKSGLALGFEIFAAAFFAAFCFAAFWEAFLGTAGFVFFLADFVLADLAAGIGSSIAQPFQQESRIREPLAVVHFLPEGAYARSKNRNKI